MPGIIGLILMLVAAVLAFMQFAGAVSNPIGIFWGILLVIAFFWLWSSSIVIEPNGSRILTLFGKYQGTIRQNGWFFVNPIAGKSTLSLRARTLNGDKLKVNDSAGNPVEIAAIIIWRVSDTYRASFEVERYEEFVRLQSETAVRHLASTHPYDAEDHEISLRRNTDIVSEDLKSELNERLARAGVEVLEARLSHLAYAPEIAGAMLRRQQATAVIAARQKIVEGAVGMVELALDRLQQHETINMNEREKAALVSNLMVVLCGDHSVQPTVNTSAAPMQPNAPPPV
ncbi:MAG: SPFH domain-containing protein [Armatimonadetes bacterium]|nr:SPFH domain-containing protein [Armatimonadota bacterium]